MSRPRRRELARPGSHRHAPAERSRQGGRELALRSTSRTPADRETRERLLAAATRLFADRGFKDVTVRQICRDADANVAAVNDHFCDKLGLYRAVLQSAIDRMHETTDQARESGKGQPPESQLRTFISIFIRRLLDDQTGTVHRLLTREMLDPTPALDAIIEQGVRPRMEFLRELIARMIGSDENDPRVLRSVASVSTQFAAYMPNAIADRLAVTERAPADADTIAEHLAQFTIAGIRAIAGQGRTQTTSHRRTRKNTEA
jgi:TetR/AcrR family transcriptional regulator, regulator of cefoperazone and chloramphenicol sensitivity